ncbi:redoxin domain-containing protein [uncultured Hymenobacter sp.]|uniref:redoxin domain-containing protein n=1 Tax=uncultured Hymenobacter sp. TaxID=170016 RepID=UPI0035CA647B
MLAVGTQAPDLELYSTPDQKIKLSALRGRKVILAFCPADWSPVCCDEMSLLNATRKLFDRHQAPLLGISVDSTWRHLAFSQSCQLHFPLLADFESKGKGARRYGVYDAPAGLNPGPDGILAAF